MSADCGDNRSKQFLLGNSTYEGIKGKHINKNVDSKNDGMWFRQARYLEHWYDWPPRDQIALSLRGHGQPIWQACSGG